MKCPFGSKTSYHDKKEAKEARKTMQYRHGWEKISIYRCPYCKKWHLTSSKY